MARRDEEEFLAFAEAIRAQLRRTAFLLSGDWERAADITQEALIRVGLAGTWPVATYRCTEAPTLRTIVYDEQGQARRAPGRLVQDR